MDETRAIETQRPISRAPFTQQRPRISTVAWLPITAGIGSALLLLGHSPISFDHSTRFVEISYAGPLKEYVSLLNTMGILTSFATFAIAARCFLGQLSRLAEGLCMLAGFVCGVNVIGFLLYWGIHLEN